MTRTFCCRPDTLARLTSICLTIVGAAGCDEASLLFAPVLDPNALPEDAVEIPIGRAITDSIDHTLDNDYYWVHTQFNRRYVVTFETIGPELLTLARSTDRLHRTGGPWEGQCENRTGQFELRSGNTATWYLKVNRCNTTSDSGIGYTIAIADGGPVSPDGATGTGGTDPDDQTTNGASGDDDSGAGSAGSVIGHLTSLSQADFVVGIPVSLSSLRLRDVDWFEDKSAVDVVEFFASRRQSPAGGPAPACTAGTDCDARRVFLAQALETYLSSIIAGVQRDHNGPGEQATHAKIIDALRPFVENGLFKVGIDRSGAGFWPDERLKEYLVRSLRVYRDGAVGGPGIYYTSALIAKASVYRTLATIARGDGQIPYLPNQVTGDGSLVRLLATADQLDRRADAIWDWTYRWDPAGSTITIPNAFDQDFSSDVAGLYPRE